MESNPSTTTGISDSFENIDSLLDDPASENQSSSTDRWRAPEQELIVSTGEVDQPADDAPAKFGSVATTSLLMRKYVLLVGSVVFGTAAAVGVIVISANRSQDNIDVADTSDALVSPSATTSEPDTLAQDPPVASPIDALPGDAETDGTLPAISRRDATNNTADNLDRRPASENSEPDEPAANVAQIDANDTPPEDLNAFDNEPDVPTANNATIGQDDELTNFVEWLKQDPRSEVTNKPAVPLPSPAEPNPENSIAPIASTNRPEPPLVNVKARLRDPIDAISFSKTPLTRTLRAIQSVSTIPISVEPDALYLGKTTAGRKISFLAKKQQTVNDLLNDLLNSTSKGKLAIEFDTGHVTVTAKSLTKYSPRPHKIADLASTPTRAVELATWIPQLIAPGTWQTDGGRATCKAAENASELTVTHNLLNQYRTYRFLHRLRAARGRPYKKLANNQTSLTPRPLRDSKFQTTVSIRLPRGATLSRIVTELERQSNVAILIDWKSLHAAGWSPKDELPFFCGNVPLGLALDQLLTPIGLAANVVDDSTLQVIYPLNDPSWDIEFYELPPGTNEQSAGDTVARIANVTGIAATSVWDQASERLIVAASQSVHRRVIEAFK
ncbi:hypothetical protein ACFL2H_12810 [Planctomycetota bacterium]